MLTGAAVVVLGGSTYEILARVSSARRNPEPGVMTTVSGRKMKIHCTGAGSPVVVLEAGMGDFLSEWRRVQPGVAAYTRVCSYDRAGYGGSSPGQRPRTSSRIALELHALLEAAGEKPPFVLVGHSFGGYCVRVFHGRYPRETAGMVLVDSTQEDQYQLLPKSWLAMSEASLDRARAQARWAPLAIGLGWTRLRLAWNGIDGGHLLLDPYYVVARASEFDSIRVSAEQAREAGALGAKPLIVITGGRPDPSLRVKLGDAGSESFHATWVNDLQPRLAKLSTRSRIVLLPDSGHDVPADRPDAIVDAVREVVAAVRR